MKEKSKTKTSAL